MQVSTFQEPPSETLLNDTLDTIITNFTAIKRKSKHKHETLFALKKHQRRMKSALTYDCNFIADNEYRTYRGPLQETGHAHACVFCRKTMLSGKYQLRSRTCNRHSYCPTCVSFILRASKAESLLPSSTNNSWDFACVHHYLYPNKKSGCSWRNKYLH
jgi:hypothetical protein